MEAKRKCEREGKRIKIAGIHAVGIGGESSEDERKALCEELQGNDILPPIDMNPLCSLVDPKDNL